MSEGNEKRSRFGFIPAVRLWMIRDTFGAVPGTGTA